MISGLVLVAGAAVLLTGEEVRADTRTISPAGYYSGSVLVDGKAPATGGTIVAETWSGWQCGSATVHTNGQSAFFSMMAVHSSDTKSGCFDPGEPIIFRFKGMKAQEIPVFSNWGEQVVHLSFKSTRYFQCTPELCPISTQPVFVLPPR